MSTWTSKSVFAGLAAFALAGCATTEGFAFAAPDLGAVRASRDKVRVAQATLADGAVTLNAPPGYCIDPRSMRNAGTTGFVLMARCDTLGVKGFFAGYDLAIITVTTAPKTPGTSDPTPADVARIAGAVRVLDESSKDGLSLVRLESGSQPVTGVSEEHWRGVFAVNGTLVGIGLYAPEGSPALRDGGAATLRMLAEDTKRASE